MNRVHVECVKPICNISALSANKILALILPMVCTNVFYHALKHCNGGWESILISYLYYVCE